MRRRCRCAGRDLQNWVPVAPTLLCGGSGDPTVFRFNTELLVGYWSLHPPAASVVTVLDVDSGGPAGDPHSRQRSAFSIAKGVIIAAALIGGATDGGARAVATAYHSELVPSASLCAVAAFFARF